jgi:arginine decarboxylase-like protein
MNHQIAKVRSAHDVGDAWTTVDAAEMYEIARWGQGYFSIGENGHVRINPTKDPTRSIDLKQLVDHLQLRGISLPTSIGCRTSTKRSRRPSPSTNMQANTSACIPSR